MIAFKTMKLTVYRRAASNACPDGEGMVAWRAEKPLIGDTDERKWASVTGLQYLSFYMTLDEFRAIMDGRVSGMNDIGHNLRVVGDAFTFFDMDFPRDARGVMHVPYITMRVPYYVRRILRRAVDAAFKRCEPDGPRRDIDLPYALRARWTRQYGRGTGGITFDMTDETMDRVVKLWQIGGESFENALLLLLRSALYTTARHTDKALVKLWASAQLDEVDWCVYTPEGQRVMNGGIINHSRDGGHEWSCHT